MSDQKIALVTGGSKGIGAAVARQLALDGMDIWLNYRSDHEGAAKVAREIEDAGRSCQLVPCDVGDAQKVVESLEPLLAVATPFAVVNNAGLARDTVLAMMPESDWDQVMQVTLNGFYNVTKPVVKKMLRQRCGRIVNIASTSGQSGMAGQVNYSAAKAGLIGATKALAREVARRQILVNAVAPGFIETEMTEKLAKDKILPTIPLGRFGQAQEIAAAVSFLCSDAAGYITGQVISVNGGIFM